MLLILDLLLPSNKSLSSFASNYVSISRAMTYDGLMILRPWKSEDLVFVYNNDLEEELKRLHKLQLETINKLHSSDFIKECLE